ncbi:CRISPR system precrRNA processing endoribonuclease RAMP protein Cas6 [Methanoregula sp.]|uniref:CRISPR system precrRNA processing endoribonuclease RAMP protein Cas6 n=1 Tax=Methanoregula sp. TaxID=2052170 RepID=UPI0035681E25
MKCSLISLDITIPDSRKLEFPGSVFRGWLGTCLKCDPAVPCTGECADRAKCPYYMVFKEQTDVKPFSVLSIPIKGGIRNFIKIYGDRRKFAPRILTLIHEHEASRHFGGMPYTVENIEARTVEMPPMQLAETTEVVFVSPTNIQEDSRQEILPGLSTLMKSCVRTYNRVTKYYDEKNYPCRIPDEMLTMEAEILDYDIRTVKIVHENMFDRRIALEGIVGSITYDTSGVHPDVGNVLKMGEFLQIGKHSTYGFGGMVVKNGGVA